MVHGDAINLGFCELVEIEVSLHEKLSNDRTT